MARHSTFKRKQSIFCFTWENLIWYIFCCKIHVFKLWKYSLVKCLCSRMCLCVSDDDDNQWSALLFVTIQHQTPDWILLHHNHHQQHQHWLYHCDSHYYLCYTPQLWWQISSTINYDTVRLFIIIQNMYSSTIFWLRMSITFHFPCVQSILKRFSFSNQK